MQPEITPNANTNDQPQVGAEKNNRIFIMPCVSVVLLGLFVPYALRDINSDSQYAGLASFILSCIVCAIIFNFSLASIILFYRKAKYKTIGLCLNIIMLLIGFFPPFYVTYAL